MEDVDIIERYHRQEKNKQTIQRYYQILNDHDWDELEKMYENLNEEDLLKVTAVDDLGLDNPEWFNVRREEYQLYERFTEYNQFFQELNIVKFGTPRKPLAELSNRKGKMKESFITAIKQQYTNRTVKIINILVEGHIVVCTLIVSEGKPKKGPIIKYPVHSIHYLNDDMVLFNAEIPHLLPTLIELAKLVVRSEDELAADYVKAMKTLGLID